MKINKSSQVKIAVGCLEYLQDEVERLRDENRLLQAEKKVMDNFFALLNRIGDVPRQGMAEDRFWQAKKEIAEAKEQWEKNQPMPAPPKGIS
jgi:FtsZ-binding cell division protein ZapB